MSKVKKPRNADHVRRKNAPTPSDEVIEARLESLLEPAVLGQQGYARLLGLRERILSFPVMVAAVLTLLWRQVPSVCELSRVLAREDCLWAPRLNVSQQALSQRFLSFPAELFQRVLGTLLPRLRQRWAERQRPLPAAVVHARQHFREVLMADGSTLEALFRKLKALQELPKGRLAGKICTVIDLASRLPRYVWFTERAQAHDINFIDRILKVARAGLLWVFDRGLYDFGFFERLIERGAAWITRSKSNLSYSVSQVLEQSDFIRDRLIRVEGCAPLLRLVEVRFERQWYRYLTSVTDPRILPAWVIADIYRRRWRIAVSSEGHILQSVEVRPRLKDSGLVVWEAPWRESKTAEPSDNVLEIGYWQSTRLQRAVNVEVASLHAIPVAETVYNVRRQQGPLETSLTRRLSPAGYQRRHGTKEDVSTGEARGVRRGKLVEEASPITVSGKWRRRRPGGGSGRSTVDRRATKRAWREGPGPVSTPLVKVRQG
jgi:hypothetical protein